MQDEITEKYTKPLTPFSIVGDVLKSGRDMISEYTNPLPTTQKLQQERQQSLIPEEAKKIKTRMAAEQGLIPIAEDRYLDITGFVGSLENVGKKVGKKVVSELDSFLKNWVNNFDEVKKLTPEQLGKLEQETLNFRPSKSVKLYRGTSPYESEITGPTSWTYFKDTAKTFADEKGGKVISKKVDPSEILLDTSEMPSNLLTKYGFLGDEEEVILKPFKKLLEPYKETGNLTTKILKDLEGKTTVSKQYILDATNRGELKQVERDISRQVLDTMPDGQINVKEFADKVKSELLPLKVSSKMETDKYGLGVGQRYENIALPKETRGNVKNYKENIYESPIKTSAGSTHFGNQSDNYFGHARIEDMADNKTRRVIEVQSDLYQKGGLEKELNSLITTEGKFESIEDKLRANLSKEEFQEWKNINRTEKISNTKSSQKRTDELVEKAEKIQNQKRKPDVLKLQQYNDPTAHFRMVREEIKKASQDGKTKLQFPTGETAMKIEGLGQEHDWFDFNTGDRLNSTTNLTVGMKLEQGIGARTETWVITNTLGDGRFKAVPQYKYKEYQNAIRLNTQDVVERFQETFDISGKIDSSNPIYKFYEKDLQKYLNKYGGQRVIDKQGVSWIEIPITKEQGKLPIEAFAAVPFGMDKFTQPLTKPVIIEGNLPRDNEDPNELSVERLKGEVAFRETGSFKKPYETIGVTGDLGKYQVNPTTLKSYSKKFLGKEVSPEEFLKSPNLQERFFENGIQHLSNLGAKSLDAFLILWHEGWGDISSKRLKELRGKENVKKYLNNRRKDV